MITKFDIGEKVRIDAVIERIFISDKGAISYNVRIPGTMTELRAAEDELYKLPENDLKCIKIPENNELEWIKEERR